MFEDYFKWPGNDEALIWISEYNGIEPVFNHKYEFLEIVFVTKGTCIHRYLGTEIILIPGDVFIVIPHKDHSYIINSQTSITNLIFFPGVISNEWPELREMSGLYNFILLEPFFRFETNKNQVLRLQPNDLTYVEMLLNAIKIEQITKQNGYKLVQKANLLSLLAFIGRVWDRSFHEKAGEYNWKKGILAEAISFIQENVRDDLNIDDIASRVFLSPDYFRKVFREATGISPTKYINSFRISKAEVLLRETGLSIREIAEMIGIGDVNYFSRLFRVQVGCSPTEYKKKLFSAK